MKCGFIGCGNMGGAIAGIRELENKGFRGAVTDCINAAWVKNKELGK